MTVTRYYLGVDGGQSSTAAIIADEKGRVLGAGRSGPCNHVSGPEAHNRFIDALTSCVDVAAREAELPAHSRFASVCCGFSGGGSDKETLTKEVIRSDRYVVTHDAEIALAGATAGRPGIIVIAGTGSMAFGRNGHEQTARAGGWGYVFGDEGSAFDLVRRALRAALQMEEGWGPKTSLHSKLLEVTNAADANELMHRLYTPKYPRARVAEWAPIVSSAALEGDVVAVEIVRACGRELARLVAGVHGRLFGDREEIAIAHIGGVFRSELVKASFAESVAAQTGNAVASPKYPPVAGALIQALRQDDNQSDLTGVVWSDK